MPHMGPENPIKALLLVYYNSKFRPQSKRKPANKHNKNKKNFLALLYVFSAVKQALVRIFGFDPPALPETVIFYKKGEGTLSGKRPSPLRQLASLTATSPKGRGLGIAAQFPAEVQSLRACPLPQGGAVAQRLRGYKWRSEKSVKAIAPTGAALAFLCFDFFFRIVKGVQPLTRCGVGGVQR